MKIYRLLTLIIIFTGTTILGQPDSTVYHLTLRQEKVIKAGKEVTGMTINGSIPGPTLRFNEGRGLCCYLCQKRDE